MHLVELTHDSAAWREFVWCNPRHADLVLEEHPERSGDLAEPILHGAPEKAIPILLRRAVGDERPLHSATDHPLRIVVVNVG